MTRTETSLVGVLLERRYRVDRLLARGGMSSVYRGVDTRLDRPVAIKIMDSRFADDRSFVDRFELEARSAAKLHHPHVVAVHDQGLDPGAGPEDARAFLVMELVDGGTLRDVMTEQGPLDIALALSVAEPVLSALAAAHRAGLVHRDVKPENVLIGRGGPGGGGVVKVGDFGLVRAVASAGTTSSSVILGTVAYLSPEQVAVGAASVRGDVYSAGILLYEMLTGRTPYTGDTAISVAYRHVNDDVPPPSVARPGLPPALDHLVVRATRRDPEARPADAGAFLDELLRVRAELGLPAVAVPVPPAPDADHVSDVEKTQPRLPVVAAGPPPADLTVPAVAPVRPSAQAHPSPAGPHHTKMYERPAGPPQQQPQVPPRLDTPPPGVPAQEPAGGRFPRRLLILWAAVVLLLGGAIGVGVWSLSGPGQVAVPKVTGLDQAGAGDQLRKVELVPAYTKELHNTAPKGTVIRTDPEAGTEVDPGSEVAVVISEGRPVIPEIPPGTAPEAAENLIRQAKLEPRRDPSGDENSDTVPKGAVVRISPPAGSAANIGDPVTLVLSKGAAPKPVPDVAGRGKDEAFRILSQAGFEPFEAGQEFAPNVPAGKVIRTSPAAGSTVTDGNKRIGVFVSNAVQVPAVAGQRPADAAKILREAGLDPKFKGRGGNDEDEEDGFNIVVETDPPAGSFVARGSKVTVRMLL